jgi:hypothetical protein
MRELILRNASLGSEPMVNLYEDQSSGKPTQIPISEWLQSGDKYRDVVERARSMPPSGFKDRFLAQLPCISPSATIREMREWGLPPHPELIKFNHIICIETVNDGATQEDLEALKTNLAKRFGHLYYAGLSTSGNGLTLIFKTFHIGYYGLGYMSVCGELTQHFGLSLDISHLNYRHRLPPLYDPNAYFNPESSHYSFRNTFLLGEWSNKGVRDREESERIITQVAVFVDEIVDRRIPMFEESRVSFQIGCSLAAEFGEYGRCYFNQIASVSESYNKSRCNAQYDKCIAHTVKNLSYFTGNGNSSIGTFFYHCKNFGFEIPKKEQR